MPPGMVEIALLAFTAALVAAVVIGVRVALKAPPTPTAPEAWIGISVLILALGGLVEGVSAYVVTPVLERALGVLYRGAYALSATVFYLGVWWTFRPESRRALTLALLGSLAATAWAVRRQMAWELDELDSHFWQMVELARAGPFAWASYESFRYAARARSQLQRGMGDPLAARRFRLWGVAAGAVTLILGVAMAGDHALGIKTLRWAPTLIAMALLAMVGAVAFYAAHFPQVYEQLRGVLRVFRQTDRLLPRSVRADADLRRRARMLLVTSACALAWVPPGLLYLARRGAPDLALLVGACGALIVVAPLILRATGSVTVGANVALASLALLVVGSVVAGGGGMHSPALSWLILIPSGGFLLAGPRSGVGWTAIALAFVWTTYWGAAPQETIAPGFAGRHPIVRPLNLSAMLTTLTAVTAYFVRQQEWALREARLASDAKSRFLAAMSHEIRTPLNGVLGMAQLLLETRPSPKQRELIATIQSSGETLLTLIDEILDLSRIEAGHVEITRAAFRPRDLLDEIERTVAPSVEGKRLAFSVSAAPDLPEELEGDPDRLRQVLLNLVGNAVKFTDRGGVGVRVRALPRPGPDGVLTCTFEVVDSGIGIPSEHASRIFERFAQLDDSSTRRYGGTGLGLAIARQLVEMMGGEIGVESHPGAGSRFWFRLPLLVPDPAALPDPQPAPAPPEPERNHAAPAPGEAHILLVEDNPVNQTVAAGMLRTLGHRVEMAADGREALAALARSRPDAILMDCQMPVMDGLEASREIRRLEQDGGGPGRVPIIALTAAAFAEDRDRCLAAGMDDYLAKPFELAALEAVLARWLPGDGPGPTPAPEPALAREPIDEIRSLGGEELLSEVARTYLDSTPALVEAATAAVAKGDAEALAVAAHPLKSSSAQLGALHVAELARELEALGRAGSTAGAAPLAEALVAEFARARRALEAIAGPRAASSG